MLCLVVCGIGGYLFFGKTPAPIARKEMRLTISAIIKWEQLNQKPFSTMNYTNENDIVSLFYVCSPDMEKTTLSDFKKNLSDDSIKIMIADFDRQMQIASQYQPVQKKESSKTEKSDPVYIKDLVPLLIMEGLDVHYALDKMELYDISLFLNAYEQRNRNNLELSRLWTFMQLSPHLSKQIKSPKDLIPFRWEIEKEAEITKEETEKGISVFEAFMKSGNQTT